MRVLVYLRRQDQWYSSFYNQDVKGIRQWSHSAYQFYQTHQVFQRDYVSLLRPWRDAFGRDNVVLRPYEPSQWPGGDIVRDFCRVVGLPELAATGESDNEGLGFHQLYLKQCLNRVGFEPALNAQVLEILLRLCPEAPARDTLFVDQRLYQRYRVGWEEVNRRLEEEYLGGAPLFREPLPETVRPDIYTVDRPTLAGLLERGQPGPDGGGGCPPAPAVRTGGHDRPVGAQPVGAGAGPRPIHPGGMAGMRRVIPRSCRGPLGVPGSSVVRRRASRYTTGRNVTGIIIMAPGTGPCPGRQQFVTPDE